MSDDTIVLSPGAQTSGTGTSTDPSLTFDVPPNKPFWVSGGVNPSSATTSQQCLLYITLASGSRIELGWIPGQTRKLVINARVSRLDLDTGASGGLLAAWLAEDCDG